jgi:quercetin dioxygenase-like cupin family protein
MRFGYIRGWGTERDYEKRGARMGTIHRWEEFPQRTVSYLAGRRESKGIKIRILSTGRIMLTEIKVKGGGRIPRHCHEAEQIIILQKGKARVTTGNDRKPRLLGPGDIWIVPSNTMHGVEYVDDVEGLEIVSPPRLDNFIGYTIQHTFFEEDENKG